MELKKIIEAGTQTLIDHVEELTELDAAIKDLLPTKDRGD